MTSDITVQAQEGVLVADDAEVVPKHVGIIMDGRPTDAAGATERHGLVTEGAAPLAPGAPGTATGRNPAGGT